MAKYSIDDNDSDSDDSEQATGTTCELCGTDGKDLEIAEVAGATLEVCADCSPNDSEQEGTRDPDEGDRTREAIRKASQHSSADPDSSWAEEGTDYDADQLPYLVADYGDRVREAREEKELSQEELADMAGLGIAMLRVIENGQAVQSSIGRSEIEDVATVLDIDIIDEDA